MSTYTISNLITHAVAGDPIKIHAHDDGYGLNITNVNIGGVDVKLTTAYSDLGVYFTAKMVLDSYSLRQAIVDGSVEAMAGTVNLSLEPVSQ